MAQAHPYDAIVLDVMLPGPVGFETCRRLRNAGVWSPVLMLTARDGVDDRVAGLNAGADDYLTKPFSFAELLARLRALARRGSVERPVELVVDDLRLDPASRRVWRGDAEVALSPKEFALLETFMRRPGQALSRLQLLEHAWDFAYENRSNVVDVYVRYLREKLDRPFGKSSFETVRGVGYRLRGKAREPPADPRSPPLCTSRSRWPWYWPPSGWFAYARVSSDLGNALDQDLRARGQDLSALVASGGAVASTQGALIENGESFSEVVDSEGRVLDATPPSKAACSQRRSSRPPAANRSSPTAPRCPASTSRREYSPFPRYGAGSRSSL